MDLRKIGKFIAKSRTEKGYTQESLAETLDMSLWLDTWVAPAISAVQNAARNLGRKKFSKEQKRGIKNASFYFNLNVSML